VSSPKKNDEDFCGKELGLKKYGTKTLSYHNVAHFDPN
jgi:hypothetical protein